MLRWKDVLIYAKYGNPEPPHRVRHSAAEWARLLTPAQYQVLREAATEPPYRNAYCRSYAPGHYACAGCGTVLFEAEEKYYAISGWPSFRQPATRAAIATHSTRASTCSASKPAATCATATWATFSPMGPRRPGCGTA